MKELLKEQYEAPATKRTRVEMENGICATSTIEGVKPGDDVGKQRHVNIDPQISEDFLGNPNSPNNSIETTW